TCPVALAWCRWRKPLTYKSTAFGSGAACAARPVSVPRSEGEIIPKRPGPHGLDHSGIHRVHDALGEFPALAFGLGVQHGWRVRAVVMARGFEALVLDAVGVNVANDFELI